jgi:hypothetical protein
MIIPMTAIIFVVVFMGIMVALSIYVAGWDYFVFGVAAVIISVGGWLVWVGAAVGVAQAVRLCRRRWLTGRSSPTAT